MTPPPPALNYIECDVPPEMTLRQWRATQVQQPKRRRIVPIRTIANARRIEVTVRG